MSRSEAGNAAPRRHANARARGSESPGIRGATAAAAAAALPDLADRLGRSLAFAAGLLQQLEAGLKQRRVQWVAARPSQIAEPPQSLDRLAQEIATAEQQQLLLLEQIAAVLPPHAVLPGHGLRLNATRIAAELPAAAAARLLQQAAAASRAAKAVHVEALLGERLLRFSQQAHDGLVQRLVQRTHPVTGQTHGYDRRARAVHGSLLGNTAPTGSLIDGRL